MKSWAVRSRWFSFARRWLVPVGLAFFPVSVALGQGNAAPPVLFDLTPGAGRTATINKLESEARAARQGAAAVASTRGWPIRGAMNGRRFELQRLDDRGHPVYIVTNNANAAISTGANLIRNVAPYHLNGDGFRIGIWDAGSARTTHQEFTGRVFSMDGAAAADHSTHVAGTLGAAGVVAAALGMAPSVRLDSYDWNSDTAEMAAAAALTANHAGKVLISNHAYGTLKGWDYGDWSGSTGYHYFGSYPDREDWKFGKYSSTTSAWDNICYNAPYYLPFKSAGNDRNDFAPPAGTTFYYISGTTWTSKAYNPAIDPLSDGWDNNGFDTMDDVGTAKNIMTIGAANDAVSGGVRSLANGTISSFSAWGPTDDGRIKPDLVANGVSLYSSVATSNNAYDIYSGTSMAAPNAAGSAILLQELYGDYFPGQVMRSSLLKALLIHTADDLGNPGPDYVYGWGHMNVKAAADIIRNPTANSLFVGTLNSSKPTDTYLFEWNGVSPIRATLCWTDPPGAWKSFAVDEHGRDLVNDLDMRVSNGATFHPYVLDANSPWANATVGDNVTDNVEQILIASPTPGIYALTVSFKGALTGGQQVYSLVVSGQSSLPSVTVTATDDVAGEPLTGQGGGVFMFSRTGSTAAPLTANFTVGGTATNGSDYAAIATSVTFAAGSATATQTINIVDDALAEGSETVVVTLVSGSGYSVGPATATLTIQDDDSVTTDQPYATAWSLGPVRNNYTGWVGMQFVVGDNPLTVSQLGRLKAAGNGTHTLKLVKASDGLDVPGGAVSISMSGISTGQFRYGVLNPAVTLAANTTYWLLSQEITEGDLWFGFATLTTTDVATSNGVVSGTGPGTWVVTPAANQSSGALNFKYSTTAPLTAYVTGTELGPVRNNYSGWVGMQIVVGASPLTVSQLGRMVAPGNVGTHTVKLVKFNDGLDVPGGSATVTTSGKTAGQFSYGSLSSPVILNAGTSYYVLSQESAGGDAWYDYYTALTTTAVATDMAVVWGTGPAAWNTYAISNHSYVPVDFKYAGAVAGNRTLTVASINPNSGVNVAISPADIASLGNGVTAFTRTYSGNTLVALTAPATVGGNSFQKWQKDGADWSASPSTTVAMDDDHTLTAVFSTPSTIAVTVQTSPPGRAFTVDGTGYSSSQTFNWIPGSSHTIATSSPQSGGTGVQYLWTGWSDSGTIAHTVSPAGATTYTANFKTQYFLTTSAGTGGTVNPPSGWFDAAQNVPISASVNGGYSFAGWTGSGAGSYTGTNNPGSVTMNGPITEAASFSAPGADSAYVTGVTLGPVRNNYSGWVGMQIVVGASPLTVTQLGRMMAPGNVGTHTVKLVKASDGLDVAGGFVAIAMSGGTNGQFRYGSLSTPVMLAAGTTYWILSQEVAGGDAWYDYYTTLTTTGVAMDNAVAWGTGPGAWNVYPISNQSFVPVDFKYASVPASDPTYVTSTVLGPMRNDYTGWVGMQIVVGASPLTVTQLGRMMAPGNVGTHTVKLVKAGDGLDVAGGSVAIAMSGGTNGQFRYGSLSTPVMLAAGTTYWILSQEVAGGDTWYDYYTTLTTTGVATDNAVTWGTGPGAWNVYSISNRSFVPVDFRHASVPASAPGYVTSTVLGPMRNNYTGWIGMQIAVGASPLTVSQLGRMMAPGNSGTHTVKLVKASDGLDVAGGSVAITMSGGTVGQFKYGSLSSPVMLAAGTTYWLLSQETAGGDMWHDYYTTLTTTHAATDNAVVWGIGPGAWQTYPVSNQSFGPVDFRY